MSHSRTKRNSAIRIIPALLAAVLAACSPEVKIPVGAAESGTPVAISPDYTDITVPANIAPLNFMIMDSSISEAVLEIRGEKGGSLLSRAGSGMPFRLDAGSWRNLLESNRCSDLEYTIYTCGPGGWTKHPPFRNHVAAEDIDPYISYRLIEPSYVAYYNIGIYQRNLESFTQTAIYENSNGDHCVNCHTCKNRRPDRTLFHVRGKNGCTVFSDNGNIKTVNTKAGPMYAACVYPAWHPTRNMIVFSTNVTGQYFFTINTEKVEVVDDKSDLVAYDAETDAITPVLSDSMVMETFPAWNPTGDRLYYCACSSLKDDSEYRGGNRDVIRRKYDSLKYDIWSMPYDTLTGRFGEPREEFSASALGKSATLPRISPDGRYMLFTLADRGQFHIWHRSSDLYIKDLESGEVRPLDKANSDNVESYHTWSSNGRWIVFSSRRDDGSYTRPYFTYFDGTERKPFILPQENPLMNSVLMKSYNIPEFMTGPVEIPAERFRDAIVNGKPGNCTYGGI